MLSGELGAGKTCFVRGLARGLGADSRAVKSPSFTLLHSYGGRRTLHHFDVYFTGAIVDLKRAGLAELLAAGDVAVIEWGERFDPQLPADRLLVAIEHAGPEERRLKIGGDGVRTTRLLASLAPGGSAGSPGSGA